MPSQIKLRRDTSTNWSNNNPTLAIGEPGYETDSGKLKIGKANDAGALLNWNSLDYVSSGTATASVSGIRISSYSFDLDNKLNFSLVGTSITSTAVVRIMDGTEILSNTDITNSSSGIYNITLPNGTYFTTDTTYTIDIRDKVTSTLYLWDVFTYSPPSSFRSELGVTSAPKTCSPKSIALSYSYRGPAVDVKFVVYTAGDVVLYQTDFITIPRYATAGARTTRYFIASPTNFPVGINCRVAIFKRNGATLYNPPIDIPIQALSVSDLYVNNNSSFNVNVSNISSYLATQAQVIYGSTIIWNQQPSPPTTISAITNTSTLVPGQSFLSYGAYRFIIRFEDSTTLETSFTYNRAVEDLQVQIIENNKFNLYATLVNVTSVTLQVLAASAVVTTYTYSIASAPTKFREISPNTYYLSLENTTLTGALNFRPSIQYSFNLTSQEDSLISLNTIVNGEHQVPISKIVNSNTDTAVFTNRPLLLGGNRAKLQYSWIGPKYNNVILRCLVKTTPSATPQPIMLNNGATTVSTTLPYSNAYVDLEINLYSQSTFANGSSYAIEFILGSDIITSAYTQYTSSDLELIQFEGTRNTRIKKQVATTVDNNTVYLYLKITENLGYYGSYLIDLNNEKYLEIGRAVNVATSPSENIIRFIRYDPVANTVSSSAFPSNILSYSYGRTYLIAIKRDDTSMVYSNPLEYRFTSPSVTNFSITNAGDDLEFGFSHGAFVNSSDTRLRFRLMVNNQQDRYADAIDSRLFETNYTLSSGTGNFITNASYTATTTPATGIVRATMVYTVTNASGGAPSGLSTNTRMLATALVPNQFNQEGVIRTVSGNTVTVEVDNPIGIASGTTATMNTAFVGLTAVRTTDWSFRSVADVDMTLVRATSLRLNPGGPVQILYDMSRTAAGDPTFALTIGQYVSVSGFTNSAFNTSGIVSGFFNDTGLGALDYSRFFVTAGSTIGLSETPSPLSLPVARLTLNPDAYYYIKAEHTSSSPGFSALNTFSPSAISGTVDICNSLGLRYYRSEIKGITVAYTSLTNATVTVERAGQIAPYDLIVEERNTEGTEAGTTVSPIYSITNRTALSFPTSVVLSGSNEFKIGKFYRPVLTVKPTPIPDFVFGRTSTIPRYIYDSVFVNTNSAITFTTYSSEVGSDGTKLYASFPYKGPPARVFFVLTDSSDPDIPVITYNTTYNILNNYSTSDTFDIPGSPLSTRLESGKTYTASLYFNTISNNADRHILNFANTKTYQYLPSSYVLTIIGVTQNTVTANFEWIGHDIVGDLTVQLIDTATDTPLTLTDNTITPGTSGLSSIYTFTLTGSNVFTTASVTYRLSVVELPDERETPPSSDFVYASFGYTPTAQSSLFKDKSGSDADRLGVAETVGLVSFSPGTNNVRLQIQLIEGSSTIVATTSYTISTTNSTRTTTFLSTLLKIGSPYNIRYILTADNKPQVSGFILESPEVYDPHGYDILVFAGQSNMAGIDNAAFYGTVLNGVRVYKAATSVPVPYEIGRPPQITVAEQTDALTDRNNKKVQILKETARNSAGDTTTYVLDDAKGPFRSSEATENTPPDNINIPYQFTNYYVNHTPSLVDVKRRVCVIVRPKSSSNFFTAGEWSTSLTTRLISAINYVRNLTTYEETPPPPRNYTCNRLNVLCWLQGESDAPRDGNIWAVQFVGPTMCKIMTETGTPYENANFLLGNILSMHFQRFWDLGQYPSSTLAGADSKYLTLTRDIDRFNNISGIDEDASNIARYKPRPVSSFGLHAIDEEVPDASILNPSSGDADNGASIHFSARSLRIYARRFFYAYLESIGRSSDIPSSSRDPWAAFAPAPITYSSLIQNITFNSTARSYRYKNNPVAYFVSAVIGTNLDENSVLSASSSSRYAIISEYANDTDVYVPYLRNGVDSFAFPSSAATTSIVINGVTLTGVRFYRTNRIYKPDAGATDITFDDKELTTSLGSFLKTITEIITGARTWPTLTYDANLSLTIEPLVYDAISASHSNKRDRIKPLPPIIGLYYDSFMTPLASGLAPPRAFSFGTLTGWVSTINNVGSTGTSPAGSESSISIADDDVIGSSSFRAIVCAGVYPAVISGVRNRSIQEATGSNRTYSIVSQSTEYSSATAIENLRPALSRDAFPYAVGFWDPGAATGSRNGTFGRGYLFNRIRGALFDDMLFFSAGRTLTVSQTPTTVSSGSGRDNSISYGNQVATISQIGARSDPTAAVNLRTMLGISSGTPVPYFSLSNTGTAVALRIRNVLPDQRYTLSYWFSVRANRVPYFNANSGDTGNFNVSPDLHLYLSNYLPVTIRTANPSSADNIIYVTGVDPVTDEIYISSVTNDPIIFSEIYFQNSFNGIVAFTRYYLFSVTSIYNNLCRVKISRLPGDQIVPLTGTSSIRGLSIKGKLRRATNTNGLVLTALAPQATPTVINSGTISLTTSIALVSDLTVVYVSSPVTFAISSSTITNSQLITPNIRYTVVTGHKYEVGQYVTVTGKISSQSNTINVTNALITSVTDTTFSVAAPPVITSVNTGTFAVSTGLPVGFYYLRNPIKGSGNSYTTFLSPTRGGPSITFYGNTFSSSNTVLYTQLYSNAANEFFRVGYPALGDDSTTEQRIHFSRGSNSSTGNMSNVYVHGNTARSWDGRWTKLELNFRTPEYTASDVFSSAYLQLGPLPMIRSSLTPTSLSLSNTVRATNTFVEYTTQSSHGLSTGDIIMSVSGFTGTAGSHLNFSFEKPVVVVSSTIFRVANDFAIEVSAFTSGSTAFNATGTTPIVTFMNANPTISQREYIGTNFNFAGFELTVR